MEHLERVYMRTLRLVYDTERQLVSSIRTLSSAGCDDILARTLATVEAQSARQAMRVEKIFGLLYLEPRTEPAWVTTALLREAWECRSGDREGGTRGCAAALLAIKRYEITLYEALLRWSEQCSLLEPLADIRRSIAEELVQASALSALAFEDETDRASLTFAERDVLH